MSNNVLITGGAGFIGLNFSKYYVDKYSKDKIIILDKFTYSSNRSYIKKVTKDKKNVHLLKGDICNKKLIFKILNKYNINKIINFAAETHVDNSIEDPKPFIDTNIYGTFNLLNCARLYWLKSKINNQHFHQISTDEVYGSLLKNQNKFKENSRFNPSSPYSSSKASSDLIALSFFKTYKMNITISNTSNNFGPFIHKEKLIPKIILSILNNKKIPIYGNGKQIREWIYVLDHVRGIEKILLKGKYGESYNLSSNFNITNIKLTKIICELMNKKINKNKKFIKKFPKALLAYNNQSEKLITFVADRKGHDFKYGLNIQKSIKSLNFKPKSEFKKNINLTIDWFLNNEKFWNV